MRVKPFIFVLVDPVGNRKRPDERKRKRRRNKKLLELAKNPPLPPTLPLYDFLYDLRDAKSMISKADENNLVKLVIIKKLKGEAKKVIAELEADLEEIFAPPSNTARILRDLGKKFQ